MYYFAEQQFIEFMLLRELILLLTDPFFEMAQILMMCDTFYNLIDLFNYTLFFYAKTLLKLKINKYIF